jgi:hypothetical protein
LIGHVQQIVGLKKVGPPVRARFNDFCRGKRRKFISELLNHSPDRGTLIAGNHVEFSALINSILDRLPGVQRLPLHHANHIQSSPDELLAQSFREQNVFTAISRDNQNGGTFPKLFKYFSRELPGARDACGILLRVGNPTIVCAQQQENEYHAVIGNESAHRGVGVGHDHSLASLPPIS